MVSFAIGNIAFGTATEPIPDGDGQIKVRRILLNSEELEAVGLPPLPSRQQCSPFTLVDAENHMWWQGCWFSRWGQSTIEDGVITIEDAIIQFVTHGPIRPPEGSNREQVT